MSEAWDCQGARSAGNSGPGPRALFDDHLSFSQSRMAACAFSTVNLPCGPRV